MRNFPRVLTLVAMFFLCFPTTAHAYIDPGIGSLILQGLAAAFISSMVFWRSLREKIKNFFLRKPTESASEVESRTSSKQHGNIE